MSLTSEMENQDLCILLFVFSVDRMTTAKEQNVELS